MQSSLQEFAHLRFSVPLSPQNNSCVDFCRLKRSQVPHKIPEKGQIQSLSQRKRKWKSPQRESSTSNYGETQAPEKLATCETETQRCVILAPGYLLITQSCNVSHTKNRLQDSSYTSPFYIFWCLCRLRPVRLCVCVCVCFRCGNKNIYASETDCLRLPGHIP